MFPTTLHIPWASGPDFLKNMWTRIPVSKVTLRRCFVTVTVLFTVVNWVIDVEFI